MRRNRRVPVAFTLDRHLAHIHHRAVGDAPDRGDPLPPLALALLRSLALRPQQPVHQPSSQRGAGRQRKWIDGIKPKCADHLFFLIAVILSEGGLPPAFSKAGNPSRRIQVFQIQISVPLCLCGEISLMRSNSTSPSSYSESSGLLRSGTLTTASPSPNPSGTVPVLCRSADG